MHLLQLTNQPLSNAGKTIIDALQICFDNDVKVWIDGSIAKKKEYPIGSIDVQDKNTISFPALKRKKLKSILEQIKEGETIIITDFLSLQLFTPEMISKYKVVHLISDIPNDKTITSIHHIYKKELDVKPLMVSETVKNYFDLRNNETIIYPPLTDASSGEKISTRKSFILGIVSPLYKNQGIEVIIQTLHKCQEILPQVNLILVGDGPEKTSLNWLIDHLHLKQRIQIVSAQDRYQKFITNFDVLIAPNPNETAWDNVIINALDQGVPVIASKTQIHQEIIEHGQSGLLFEPGNSHVLAQHIINLYNHADWMQHYKKNGPQIVRDRFTIEKFKSEFLKS